MIDFATSILTIVGFTSVGGFLTVYAAWMAFPPELVVDAVVDKSKKFNSESRLRIKNNGKLPALSISADVEGLCAVVGGLTMKDCGFINGPKVISRLSNGETAEISISPGVHLAQAMQITQFSYLLVLKHHAKLFLFRKSFSKRWRVELRNFEDGFAWHIVPA